MKFFLWLTAFGLYLLSAGVVLGTILITQRPSAVLTNWNVMVDPGDYYPGDMVTVHSSGYKDKNYQGITTRYLECSDNKGSSITYQLNSTPTYRPAKQAYDTTYQIQVPQSVSPLPTTCYVTIRVDYKINFLNTFRQSKRSNTDFTVLPRQSSSAPAAQAQVVPSNQVNQSSMPSINSTASASGSTPAVPDAQTPTTPSDSDNSTHTGFVSNLLKLIF